MNTQSFSYRRAAGVLICAAALSLSSCSDKEKTPPTAKEVAIEKLEEQGVALTPASMCEAIRVGNQEQVRLLIEAGVDVNKADEYGYPPLSQAAEKGHSECVKLLLAAPGIDVNKSDDDGQTPLYRAAVCGYSECVKLLLAVPGIDVNKADSDGETPLNRAAYYRHSECVKLLEAAGAKK